MKLNKIFGFLLPKDNKFFPLFIDAADNLVLASELLMKLVRETDQISRESLVTQIRDVEHIGDDITRKLLMALNGTFITPFDREDIHDLTNKMDDVVDYIHSASKRIHYYKLYSLPEEFVRVADLIHSSNKEIQSVLCNVKSINDFQKHIGSCERISEMESKVDDIYQEYLAYLFDQEENAIDLIKKRDILTILEKAIDKCDDIANIFTTIIIKMS